MGLEQGGSLKCTGSSQGHEAGRWREGVSGSQGRSLYEDREEAISELGEDLEFIVAQKRS